MKDSILEIINTFTQHEYTPKVIKSVHKWLIQKEYETEKDDVLYSIWNETPSLWDTESQKSFDNVQARIKQETLDANVIGKKRNLFIFSRIAAIITLVLLSSAITYYLTSDKKEISLVEVFSASGTMKDLILPDGTQVKLNSSTTLLYPKIFEGKTRTVYLIGEANFKVAKNTDQPFIVKSSEAIDVIALGTEFNISSYPEEQAIIATLIEGSVRVDSKRENKSYVLVPGEQIRYEKEREQSLLTSVNTEYVTSWMTGQLIFNSVTLPEILSVLERRFNISFQYNTNNLCEDKFKVKFNSNAGLEDILSVLSDLAGPLDYNINGSTCQLTMKK